MMLIIIIGKVTYGQSVEGVQEALLNHRTTKYQGDHLIEPEDL